METIKPIKTKNIINLDPIKDIKSSLYIDGMYKLAEKYRKETEEIKLETNSQESNTIVQLFEEDSGLDFNVARYLMALGEKQPLPSEKDKNYNEAISKKVYEEYGAFGEGEISPMYEYKTINNLHKYNDDGTLNENVKYDKEGFAYIVDERGIKTYIVAMGTKYVKNMGDKFLIEIQDENKRKYIQVMAMDIKADEHTDKNNMYTYLIKDKTIVDRDDLGNPVYASNTSVGGLIEFATINKDVMSASTGGTGDCSDAKDILKGKITSIYKVKSDDSFLKQVQIKA